MRRESFSVMMSESRALQRCGGAKQLIWARFRVDNVRQVPMMEEESAEPVPSAFRATSDDMNEWKDLDSTLGVPKPWSMVDVPDLFLTNLIHDVDHTFTDDSLTEFSSTMNHSGSDSESNSDAFKDFMMRQSSPESLSNTPPLAVSYTHLTLPTKRIV